MSDDKRPDQPREWWIETHELVKPKWPQVYKSKMSHTIHVIEKSAYIRMENAAERWKQEAVARGQERDALNDRYEQACDSDNAWRKRCEELERGIAFASGDGWNELPKLREELAAAKAEIERLNRECISTFLHEARMQKANARIKELEHDIEVYGQYAEKFGDLSNCYDAHDVTCVIQRAFEDVQEREQALVEAICASIARADDYADSYCSQPIREAFKKHRGE